MMTPVDDPEKGFKDHSDLNHPGSEVCLICIFGEDTPGTLVYNDSTKASVVGDGVSDICLSHSSDLEPGVFISD